jgi:hypothetical protein
VLHWEEMSGVSVPAIPPTIWVEYWRTSASVSFQEEDASRWRPREEEEDEEGGLRPFGGVVARWVRSVGGGRRKRSGK